MKIMLILYILVSGTWIVGSEIDGWSPREQSDLNTCLERAHQINKNNKTIKAECHIIGEERNDFKLLYTQ
jgi:hypothetical protein|tara:strand:- start:2509 stop:2718 length:210 start_codon:yes stop_codon:yes gene_type:complete